MVRAITVVHPTLAQSRATYYGFSPTAKVAKEIIFAVIAAVAASLTQTKWKIFGVGAWRASVYELRIALMVQFFHQNSLFFVFFRRSEPPCSRDNLYFGCA